MIKNAVAKVFILCLSLTVLHAQDSETTQFRFGIHGTPNISYISTDDPAVETSSILKFGYGLLAEYHFAENYAFSSGITVMTRGGKLTSRDTTGEYSSQFIQIPLLLKMSTREFGYFTYFAEFGGSLDIEISEEVEFSPGTPGAVRESYVPPFNAMFSIGAGAEYNLGGTTALMAGLYYNRSLIDNINDNHPLVDEVYNYRFDYVSLKLGVLF